MSEYKKIIDLLKKQDKKISQIDKKLSSHIKTSKSPKSKTKQKTNGAYSGLAGGIFDLTKSSFFNKPKELKEIIEQLKANAVFYPRTNYPDALLRLVKNKDLRRLKDKNKWKYVKYG